MKINIISNLFGSSGFSVHTKNLANALHELGAEVRIDCPKFEGWEQLVNDAELIMLNRKFSTNMISILIGQPQYLPFVWAENPKDTILFFIWEGENIPKFWLKYLLDERVKQIWVPSVSSKNAILNTTVMAEDLDYLDEKIKIVPHGYNPTIFNPEENKNEKFRFLSCKGWRGGINDRGGVGYLLKAYLEEFTKDDNVELVLKLNPAYLPAGFDIKQEIEKLGIKKHDKSPSLLVSTDDVAFKKMKEFYNGDVFVTSSMADAFDMPPLEALACGIPVIATNYGGHIDFVNDKNGWLIDGELVDVTWDIQHEGNKWLKPNLEALKKQMRYCYEHPEEVKEKRNNIYPTIQEWTWRKAAEKALRFLEQIN